MTVPRCLSSPWPGFNFWPWWSIPRDFPLADQTLPTHPEPGWKKMAQSPLNDTTQYVDSDELGRPKFNYGQWLKKEREKHKAMTIKSSCFT